MKQNKYDESEFFDNYSKMARSVQGLEAAGEWHELQTLLPNLKDKRVLDLGCGFGWHCRYAREQQASSVIGVDLSENMLQRAREMTDDPQIQYEQLAIEDIDFAPGQFDVVISSLALHYIERLDTVYAKINDCLAEGGHLYSPPNIPSSPLALRRIGITDPQVRSCTGPWMITTMKGSVWRTF